MKIIEIELHVITFEVNYPIPDASLESNTRKRPATL